MKVPPADDQTNTNTAGEHPSLQISDRFALGPLKPWQAYVVATVATAATLGARLALDAQLGGRPTLVIFTLPILLSAYLGGLRAGLLATDFPVLARAITCCRRSGVLRSYLSPIAGSSCLSGWPASHQRLD